MEGREKERKEIKERGASAGAELKGESELAFVLIYSDYYLLDYTFHCYCFMLNLIYNIFFIQ